jgi:hypothetical protein
LADAEINRDANLRLQYLAGLTPRGAEGLTIHRELLAHHSAAEAMFRGSAERMEALRQAIEALRVR